MWDVCICDDSPRDLQAIEGLVKQAVRAHPELPLRLHSFRSPFDLLDALEQNGGFDLYLLDILMPHFPGVELARHIRERGEAAEILFLTTSREYAVEAFGVEACGYLLKPVNPEELEHALLAAARRLFQRDSAFLLLKTTHGLRKLHHRELMLVESFNQRRVCTLADGSEVQTPTTLSSLKASLSTDPRFFSPHRAYLVNLEYVSGFTANELYLPGERRIPIARKLYTSLKSAYMDYVVRKKSLTPPS